MPDFETEALYFSRLALEPQAYDPIAFTFEELENPRIRHATQALIALHRDGTIPRRSDILDWCQKHPAEDGILEDDDLRSINRTEQAFAVELDSLTSRMRDTKSPPLHIVEDPPHEISTATPRVTPIWNQEATADTGAVEIIEDLIHADSIGMIYGPPGTLKTQLAFDMAAACITGQPWAGRWTRQTAWIVIAAEGRGGIERRLAALHAHHTLPAHTLAVLPQIARLHEADAVDALTDALLDIIPTLELPLGGLIYDTLSAHTPGADENSGGDMGEVRANLRRQIETLSNTLDFAPAALVVHHTGKSEARGARGHSSWEGDLDTILKVNLADQAADGMERTHATPLGDRIYRVTAEKVKDGEDNFLCGFRPTLVTLGTVERDDGSTRTLAAPLVTQVWSADDEDRPPLTVGSKARKDRTPPTPYADLADRLPEGRALHPTTIVQANDPHLEPWLHAHDLDFTPGAWYSIRRKHLIDFVAETHLDPEDRLLTPSAAKSKVQRALTAWGKNHAAYAAGGQVYLRFDLSST